MVTYNIYYFILFHQAFTTGVDGMDYGPVDKYYQLHDDGTVIVQSQYFPQKCCTAKNYQVSYIGSRYQHIRLEFTDIDIPLGSAILLLDDNNELLPDQPNIIDKSYIRKGFAFNGSSIKIIFKPISSKLTSYYAGFMAEVKAVTELPSQWDFWPTSEQCEPVNDVMLGGVLELKNQPSIYDNGVRLLPSMPLHDCIWVFKMPAEFKSNGFAVKLFLRVDEMIIDANLKSKFELTVKKDNSEGVILKQFSGETTITNETAPEVIRSRSDLYVRLKLPYTTKYGTEVDHYTLRITYGIYSQTNSTTHDCLFGPFTGFNCQKPQWCVPLAYKCNGIINCANIEDEVESTCAAKSKLITTTASVVIPTLAKPPYKYGAKSSPGNCDTTEKYCLFTEECVSESDYYLKCTSHNTKCQNWEKKCPDNRCISKWRKCEENICSSYRKKCDDGRCISSWLNCDNDCRSYEKQCNDGTCVSSGLRCPEDPCPSYKPVRCDSPSKCLYSSYKCDDYCDCGDCHDESSDICEGSNYESHTMPLPIIVLLPILVVLVFSCVCFILACRRKTSQRDNGVTGNTTQSNYNTTFSSGTAMHPVVSGVTPRSPDVTYTPVPTQGPNTPARSMGIHYDIPQPIQASAPPAYGEALDTTAYPPTQSSVNQQETLPPPPSYESVTANGNDSEQF